MNNMSYKSLFCGVLGISTASYIELLRGVDAGILLLVTLMGIDYAMGIYVSLILRKSPKTKTGGCASSAAFAGAAKKAGMLALVLVGFLLDNYMHQSVFCDAIAVAFIASEFISVLENAALMGIRVPTVLKDGLELLRKEKAIGRKKHDTKGDKK